VLTLTATEQSKPTRTTVLDSWRRPTRMHNRVARAAIEVRSLPFRYVWPAELDLMARLAGMSLIERSGDSDRSPFTGASRKHVSVWETPAH
jgi:hypothetical protein